MTYCDVIKINLYVIALLILVAVGTIMLTFFQVNNHNKEIEIQKQWVYQMLGGYEKGIDGKQAAGSILKGDINNELIEKGRNTLKAYGYSEDYQTTYDLIAKKYKTTIIINNTVIYFIIVGVVFITTYFMKKRETEKFENINSIVNQFIKGEYIVNLPITIEEVHGKLNSNLESLGKKLLLNEERLNLEKEETKTLVTDISHQLKTPIASLKMCVSILNEDTLDKVERKEFMERSIDQVNHLEHLTAALINISRMETGLIKIERENKRIVDTILSAINSVYIKAEGKGILIDFESELSNDIENILLPHDEKWTKEAIGNVLENAIKYSEKETKIIIKMSKLISFLRIEIQDQGIGIDKKEYTKVFRRFYRGKSEIVKKAEGSGVGLYLTRKILEEQGGNITVTSRKTSEGRGSTFVIQLSLV